MVEEVYLPKRRLKPDVLVYEVVAIGRQADARRRKRDGIDFELAFLRQIVEKVV